MATISHIPNPISISVKIAGYTIPANRYARAVVNVIGSGTFTIGGVTALAGTQNNVLASTFYPNSSASPGAISVQTSVGVSGTIAGSSAVVDQKNLVHDYFLPAGTVINGTGTWRATVEEYGG